MTIWYCYYQDECYDRVLSRAVNGTARLIGPEAIDACPAEPSGARAAGRLIGQCEGGLRRSGDWG